MSKFPLNKISISKCSNDAFFINYTMVSKCRFIISAARKCLVSKKGSGDYRHHSMSLWNFKCMHNVINVGEGDL